MYTILSIFDIFLFIYSSICIIYIVTFAISSHFYKENTNDSNKYYNSFLIIIPAYKEDYVIKECLLSILESNYPKDKIHILVVSDRMTDTTNREVEKFGINILKVNYKNSSKAKALKSALNTYCKYNDEYVLILDADNIIPSNYLYKANIYINNTNCIALQTHRTAKKIINSLSYLDATIEEINNTIFRQGHAALNISSALIGSGMFFKKEWLNTNINTIKSTGEDKEIEELLLKQNIKIYYSKNIVFKDDKTYQRQTMSNQRTRWMATQIYLIRILSSNIINAILHKNKDYVLKFIETFIPPRSLMIAFLLIIVITTFFINPYLSIKWTILFLCLIFGLFISIPSYLKNKKLVNAICNVPFFIYMMFKNLFKIKGASKKFIHTEHT